MITKELNFKYRGKSYSGTVALPESIEESVQCIGYEETQEAILKGLEELAKINIRTPMQKWVKVRTDSLNDDQIAALKQLGLL